MYREVESISYARPRTVMTGLGRDVLSVGTYLPEYHVLDTARSKVTGDTAMEPDAYGPRFFAFLGNHRRNEVVLPDIDVCHRYVQGQQAIWRDMGADQNGFAHPIWFGDKPDEVLDILIAANIDAFAKELQHHKKTLRIVAGHAHPPEQDTWREELAHRYGVNTQRLIGPKRYDPIVGKNGGRFHSDRWHAQEFAKKYGLPYPVSRTVYQAEDFSQAVQEVQLESGCGDVWAKAGVGAGGWAVQCIDGKQNTGTEFLQMFGNVSLYNGTVGIEVQQGVESAHFFSWQYYVDSQGICHILSPGGLRKDKQDRPSGYYLGQIMYGQTWIGGTYNMQPQGIPAHLLDEADTVVNALQIKASLAKEREYRSRGATEPEMGGFDFTVFPGAGEQSAIAMLIEENRHRMPDTVPALLTAEANGVDTSQPFAFLKPGKPLCNNVDLWAWLKKQGLAYNNGKGIVLGAWLPDPVGFGNVCIAGTTDEEVQQISDSFMEGATREGFLLPKS